MSEVLNVLFKFGGSDHIPRVSPAGPAFTCVPASLASLAIVLTLSGSPARADILPPATTIVTCVDGALVTDPSACANGGAFAVLTQFPFVSETVRASAAPGPQNGAGALANITYSFQVLGGTPGQFVPLLIQTDMSVTATSVSHALGFASLTVQTSQGFAQVCVDTAGSCGGATQFSGVLRTGALSGELGDLLVLEAEANAGDSPLFESASAFADPFIFVDPTFPGADQFIIQVSPGIGNTLQTPVPEPASFALLGSAILMLVCRRRIFSSPKTGRS